MVGPRGLIFQQPMNIVSFCTVFKEKLQKLQVGGVAQDQGGF